MMSLIERTLSGCLCVKPKPTETTAKDVRMSLMTVNQYAGLGASNTPDDVLCLMNDIGCQLSLKNVILRSNAKRGAASAFEAGCNSAYPERKQIFLPFEGFNSRSVNEPCVHIGDMKLASNIASRYNRRWRYLKAIERKIVAATTFQILGQDTRSVVRFLICWTGDGSLDGRKTSGGTTGQALRIATTYNVPIYNLYRDEHRQIVEQFLKKS